MRLTKKNLVSILASLVLVGCGSSSSPSTQSGNTPEDEEENLGPVYVDGCNINGLPFGGGDGTPSSPYMICSIEHLNSQVTGEYASANFKMIVDLDATDKEILIVPSISGTFDGNGKKIANWLGVGPLFQSVSGTVKDVHLENVSLAGSFRMGLVGTVEATGLVEDCSVQGAMTAPYMIGGIAGLNKGIVSRSTANVTLAAIDTLGGLVAYNQGQIIQSSAAGSTIVNTTLPSSIPEIRGFYFGGLVGMNDGGTITQSSSSMNVVAWGVAGGLVGELAGGAVSRSFATGSVSATGNQVGGLVGASESSSISNSYAQGSVQGAASVGGLVGDSKSNITNSYSVGSVAGSSSNVGGFVGKLSAGSVTASFWDIQTSGQASSAAGSGVTTSAMKDPATFSAWDSSVIWSLSSGSYPALQ